GEELVRAEVTAQRLRRREVSRLSLAEVGCAGGRGGRRGIVQPDHGADFNCCQQGSRQQRPSPPLVWHGTPLDSSAPTFQERAGEVLSVSAGSSGVSEVGLQVRLGVRPAATLGGSSR